jgi:hypothetical protein
VSASAPVRLAALGAALAGAAAAYVRGAEPHVARWGSTDPSG